MSRTEPKLFSLCLGKFRFLESEQQKLRPVIVVGKPYGRRRILMVIPISSSSKAETIDVVVKSWKEVGLLKPSVARLHRLSAMLEDDLLEQIGLIDIKHQAAIKSALKELLSI